MSDEDSDEMNDDFYQKVLKAKCDNPEMFVSNWEQDNADICSWTENEIKEDPNKQLITEAEVGDLDSIRALVEDGKVDINAADNDGYRALHRACYNGHIGTAEYLISKGANINAQTTFGWTPLHSSVYWNQLGCVKLLLRNGADINALTEGGQTALHLACSKFDVLPELLSLLLSQSDVNIELRNAQGDTSLDLAIRHTPFEYFFYPFKTVCVKLHE